MSSTLLRDEDRNPAGFVGIARDIGKQKAAEEQLQRQADLLSGINRLLREGLTCETDGELARTCLAVAEELTGSKFGWVGELNEEGRFDAIALSDPGWHACKMPRTDSVRLLKSMEIRGIWAGTFETGRSVIVNDPASHPRRVGIPEGHPAITCFLGVPLKQGEKTIGMIGLGNKECGYDGADQESVEALSVAFVDALNRKRAEEKLRETTVELARSNKELEEYAYVASHDLQEPLRGVMSYLQLLERRYGSKLDADAKRFVTRPVAAAKRMQALINDLLEYSRVGTDARPFGRTDCAAVLDRALANLRVAVQESNATVTHGRMPTVMADATQLTQLFQNLIANAIKFKSEEPPQIQICARHVQESALHLLETGVEMRWRFSVQDNGIGLDLQHAERIFVIFQRLHARDEYSGTGIGLAMCKKIVERHGGRIWVESQPGQGATFHFTIPDRL